MGTEAIIALVGVGCTVAGMLIGSMRSSRRDGQEQGRVLSRLDELYNLMNRFEQSFDKKLAEITSRQSDDMRACLDRVACVERAGQDRESRLTKLEEKVNIILTRGCGNHPSSKGE